MIKLISIAVAIIVLGAAGAMVYQYNTTTVVNVPAPETSVKRDHGDFEKRFRPELPPGNEKPAEK